MHRVDGIAFSRPQGAESLAVDTGHCLAGLAPRSSKAALVAPERANRPGRPRRLKGCSPGPAAVASDRGRFRFKLLQARQNRVPTSWSERDRGAYSWWVDKRKVAMAMGPWIETTALIYFHFPTSSVVENSMMAFVVIGHGMYMLMRAVYTDCLKGQGRRKHAP